MRDRDLPVGTVVAHVVRSLAVVSLVAAGLWWTPADAALMFLVVGGATVPLGLRVPWPLDVLYVLALLVAAWSSVLDLYDAIAWWDVALHVVATGVVALVAYAAMAALGVVPDVGAVQGGRASLGVVLVTVALGSALSVLWEVAEWWGFTYLDPQIGVGYDDTVGDLVAGAVGSGVAAVVMLAVSRRADGRPSAATAASRPS